jgi:hypothetical protein
VANSALFFFHFCVLAKVLENNYLKDNGCRRLIDVTDGGEGRRFEMNFCGEKRIYF